jgi:hypothetical protein
MLCNYYVRFPWNRDPVGTETDCYYYNKESVQFLVCCAYDGKENSKCVT